MNIGSLFGRLWRRMVARIGVPDDGIFPTLDLVGDLLPSPLPLIAGLDVMVVLAVGG
jgi:hypothetical protein